MKSNQLSYEGHHALDFLIKMYDNKTERNNSESWLSSIYIFSKLIREIDNKNEESQRVFSGVLELIEQGLVEVSTTSLYGHGRIRVKFEEINSKEWIETLKNYKGTV